MADDDFQGGVNASILYYEDDKIIAIHGKENIDTTSKGRLVCYRIPTEYPSGDKPILLGEGRSMAERRACIV